MIKQSYQRFGNVLLVWSIIYFFSLLVLEDTKKSIVTSHFAPHWILFIILLLAGWQLWQGQEWNPVQPPPKRVRILFYMSLLGSGLVFIWVAPIKLVGLIFACFYIFIFYFLGKKIITQLYD
jgi:hypothetical protein